MKKWFCNSIIILSTITTCVLLSIILSDDSSQNSTEEKLIVRNESVSNKIENNPIEKEKNKTNEAKEKKENLTISNDEETANKEALRIAKQEYFMWGGECEEEYSGDWDLDNYKSVFKVDSRTIVNNLSMMDKLKLLSIASKLSKTDYKKIDGYLKEDNAEEGVKKAYKVLKEKLNDKDMNKIKDVLESYIDVDIIEKK